MIQVARRSARLRVSDLSALIKLAGEAGELRPRATERRRHILGGLCDLCGADKGVYGQFVHTESSLWDIRPGSALFHQTPNHELNRVSRFYQEHQPRDPIIDFLSRSAEPILVCTPRDLFSQDQWRNSEHFNEVRKPSQIEEQLYANYRSDAISHGLGLHRRNRKPFGGRETALVSLFLRNAGQLLRDVPTNQYQLIEKLPARLRPVLNCFLQGHSEKEVAQRLGLTPHTIHTYAKQIYRRLNVTSRAEMMALFVNLP